MMQDASDETYENHPESIRIIALTGSHPRQEMLGVSDHPDADVPGVEEFVRYIRADESDLHGFVPEHWQRDAETYQRLLAARQLQFLHVLEELQGILDGSARDTRDRLQRIRTAVEHHREEWSSRVLLFDVKQLDDSGGDMI